jgi:cytoskeletal protein CcmA (bactofilin family)
MFGKDKDNDAAGGPKGPEQNHMAAPPLKPFSRKATTAAPKPAAQPFRADIPRRVVDIPGAQRRPERMLSLDDEANRLTVGRNICLSGEITACQKLVVEGQVEAQLTDAQVIEVAPTGYFRGNAEVDEAEISGRFEGTLVARQKLTIRKGGRIDGSVRYGRIVIESGGEISGEMSALDDSKDGVPVPGAGVLDR